MEPFSYNPKKMGARMHKELCEMQFVSDEQGNEMLLKDGKFQVMMHWEKPYMEACIDALQPFGDVLEIGFGCGYSASRIQSYKVKSHTIVEYHPVVLRRAKAWAENYPNVSIVEGTWQDKLSSLGKFDCIFFDDYPLESEGEMQELVKEKREGVSILSKGHELIASVRSMYPELEKQQYNDGELIQFVEIARGQPYATALHIARFFFELKIKKQITETQCHMLFKHLVEMGMLSEDDLQLFDAKGPQSQLAFQKRGDRLFSFLGECLKNHMHIGSRFSCFLSDPCSKYEDREWVDNIILNHLLDYEEKKILVDVPAHCDYYHANEALVILIGKRGEV